MKCARLYRYCDNQVWLSWIASCVVYSLMCCVTRPKNIKSYSILAALYTLITLNGTRRDITSMGGYNPLGINHYVISPGNRTYSPTNDQICAITSGRQTTLTWSNNCFVQSRSSNLSSWWFITNEEWKNAMMVYIADRWLICVNQIIQQIIARFIRSYPNPGRLKSRVKQELTGQAS